MEISSLLHISSNGSESSNVNAVMASGCIDLILSFQR
jgi:hypothetical protein